MEASSPPRYLHQVVCATALFHVALLALVVVVVAVPVVVTVTFVVVAVSVGAAVSVGVVAAFLVVVAAVKSSASGSVVFALVRHPDGGGVAGLRLFLVACCHSLA